MDYKQLLSRMPDGSLAWPLNPAMWIDAESEDIIQAAIHKFFHSGASCYEPRNIWDEPIVGEICKLLGTSPAALRNRGLAIHLDILPSPVYPIPFIPPFSRFNIEPTEVSSAFFRRVADEILKNDSAVEAAKELKSNIIDTQEENSKRRRGMELILAGSIADFLFYLAAGYYGRTDLQVFSMLPLLGLTIAMRRLRWKNIQRRMQRNDAFYEAEKIVSCLSGKLWAEEALKEGFAAHLFVPSNVHNQGVPMGFVEFTGPASDPIKQLVYNAEDQAENLPPSAVAFSFQALSKSSELGSTTIFMTVSKADDAAPDLPERRKRQPKRTALAWTGKPAHAFGQLTPPVIPALSAG